MYNMTGKRQHYSSDRHGKDNVSQIDYRWGRYNYTQNSNYRPLKPLRQKKRVTAGEVDTWGKELGKCTHQWTTNDEKNKQALSTLSVFFGLKKKDRQQQQEERSREEDRREGGN